MLPRPELMEIFSAATAFVCPSVYEPFGLVNVEAMACETAVVASQPAESRRSWSRAKPAFWFLWAPPTGYGRAGRPRASHWSWRRRSTDYWTTRNCARSMGGRDGAGRSSTSAGPRPPKEDGYPAMGGSYRSCPQHSLTASSRAAMASSSCSSVSTSGGRCRTTFPRKPGGGDQHAVGCCGGDHLLGLVGGPERDADHRSPAPDPLMGGSSLGDLPPCFLEA